jgi:hypothetical protein
MRGMILAFALVVATPSVLASDFRDASWKDAMNDTSSTVQKLYSNTKYYQSSDPKDYLGFRCDVSPTGKDFFLIFGSDESISTPSNSRVTLKIRVDSGGGYEVNAKMFSNSYRSGTIKEFPNELISEIKTGSKLLVNIYSYKTKLVDQQTFHLAGSNAAVSQVQKACGITSIAAKPISVDEKAIQKVMRLYLKGDIALDEVMKVSTTHYAAINK